MRHKSGGFGDTQLYVITAISISPGSPLCRGDGDVTFDVIRYAGAWSYDVHDDVKRQRRSHAEKLSAERRGLTSDLREH